MKAVYLLVAVMVAGCATVRDIDVGDLSSVREGLEAGDQVTLTTRDDQRYQFTVIRLSDRAIIGDDQDGRSVTIPYDEVALLQVREPRPGRTAAVVGGTIGGLVILYAIAAALAAAALASNL